MSWDNWKVEEMFREIKQKLESIEQKLDASKQTVGPLDGDRLLDNQDLCEILGVTKRTLQRYRQKNKVSYYMIDGRTYYKASEVGGFLQKKGKILP